MTKGKVSVSIVIVGLFVSSMVLLPASFRPAHGQFTGLVCLSAVTTSCPSSPPTFTGTVGSQITVNVVIQGSDSLNGFDVSVQSDPTILNPTSISTVGNVFSGQSTFNANESTQNGVARLAEVVFNFVTPNPTTGLLFSITYNVVGTSAGTSLSYPSGCTSSSVSGTTTCVSVVNAGAVDPETVQGASFANSSGDFTVTASSSSLSISKGSSGSLTITVSSTGGFVGTVNLSATVSPIVKHGLSAKLNPSSVMVNPSASGISMLTVSALHSTPSGSYTVTVTASSGTISHSVTIQVTVH